MKVSKVTSLYDYDSEDCVYDKGIKSGLYKVSVKLMCFKYQHPELPIAKIHDVFFVHSNNEALFPNKVFSGENNIASHLKSRDGYLYTVTIMEKLSKFQGKEDIRKELKSRLEKELIQQHNIEAVDSSLMMRQIGKDHKEPILVDYDDWQVPMIGES